MEKIKMSAMEKQWRAQSDARTLMDAASITQDKARLTAAQREAAKVARIASSASGGGKAKPKSRAK